jgi:hypothetical protein
MTTSRIGRTFQEMIADALQFTVTKMTPEGKLTAGIIMVVVAVLAIRYLFKKVNRKK